LPSTYTGGAITANSIDAAALKTNINHNFQSKGVVAQVSAVEVKNVQTSTVTNPPDEGSASGARRTTSPGVLAARVHMAGVGLLCMFRAPLA